MTSHNQLSDIQKQIEELQKQAAQIKETEFQNTVDSILTNMKAFGITLKHLIDKQPDLSSVLSSPRVKAAKPAKESKEKKVINPVAPKYRGPNGEVWSGRGLTPKWLSSLIEQGHSKEKYSV